MILSDALSRRPDFCPDEDHDNEDKIALSDTLDQQPLDALTFLLNDSLTVPSSLKQDIKDWTVHMDDGHQYLFYQGKAYIPQNVGLRRDIVRTFHDHILCETRRVG